MLPVMRGEAVTVRQIAGYAMITVSLTLALDAHRRRRPVLRDRRRGARRRCSCSRRSRSGAIPDPKRAIRFFAFSNVYLMLVFVAVAVDALIT